MLQTFVKFAIKFENLLKTLPSPISRIFLLFLLWASVTFILFLIAVLGGIFSGWLVAFSIIANIVWLIVVISTLWWILEET